MPLELLEDVDIRIMEARCGTFESGRCYSANNPFYSGHYETAEAALKEAKRTKKALHAAGQAPRG